MVKGTGVCKETHLGQILVMPGLSYLRILTGGGRSWARVYRLCVFCISHQGVSAAISTNDPLFPRMGLLSISAFLCLLLTVQTFLLDGWKKAM